MIRVLVADDHAIVRGGLEQLLSTAADIEVVAMVSDGEEAVAVAARERPDVVLMDLSMPVLDGIEATKRIVADNPDAHVVVLTSFSENRRIMEALGAGAIGYLLKHAGPDELLGAIRAASSGDSPLDPKAARAVLEERRGADATQELSPREQEVLLLVRKGRANKQIARELGISERTVKAHLTNIFASDRRDRPDAGRALGGAALPVARRWGQSSLPWPLDPLSSPPLSSLPAAARPAIVAGPVVGAVPARPLVVGLEVVRAGARSGRRRARAGVRRWAAGRVGDRRGHRRRGRGGHLVTVVLVDVVASSSPPRPRPRPRPLSSVRASPDRAGRRRRVQAWCSPSWPRPARRRRARARRRRRRGR